MTFNAGDIPSVDSPFETGEVIIPTLNADSGPSLVKYTEDRVQELVEADAEFATLSPEAMLEKLSAYYDQVGTYNPIKSE